MSGPDSKLRILIVDDDEPFRTRLARSLSARGHDVAGAASGEDALRVARVFQPDRAVIDLRMTDGSGLDVLSDLQGEHPLLQSILLTGYGSIATATEAVRRGALDYLTKPVDADDVLRAFQPLADEVAATVPSLQRVEWEH
ncbi:MAG TPA: response regulator, partial [Myxococcota bacterium]|nr:response regulator [Myxococcota bacterium]